MSHSASELNKYTITSSNKCTVSIEQNQKDQTHSTLSEAIYTVEAVSIKAAASYYFGHKNELACDMRIFPNLDRDTGTIGGKVSRIIDEEDSHEIIISRVEKGE